MKAFIIMISGLALILLFQNCGQGFKSNNAISLQLSIPADKNNQEENISINPSDLLAAPNPESGNEQSIPIEEAVETIPQSTENSNPVQPIEDAIAETTNTENNEEQPTDSSTSTTQENSDTTSEEETAATENNTNEVSENPSGNASTTTNLPVNGMIELTSLPQAINEPSYVNGHANVDISSDTEIPLLPSEAKYTALFCNIRHLDLQNDLPQETLVFRSNMIWSAGNYAQYCPQELNLKGRLVINSTLLIKGNLLLAGTVDIMPGAKLIVEGDIIHIGMSPEKPGMIIIREGGILNQTAITSHLGVAGYKQYGLIFNMGDYQVGPNQNPTPKEDVSKPNTLSMDLDLSSGASRGDLFKIEDPMQ